MIYFCGISSWWQKVLEKREKDYLTTLMHNTVNYTSIGAIELFLTHSCNLNCEYCFVKTKKDEVFCTKKVKSILHFFMLYSGNKNDIFS